MSAAGRLATPAGGDAPPVRVRLLHVPGCPALDQLRRTLADCLRRTGVRTGVEYVEGAYPSPTVLIDGVDVVTGQVPAQAACCRLDLPTDAQIIAALRKGATR